MTEQLPRHGLHPRGLTWLAPAHPGSTMLTAIPLVRRLARPPSRSLARCVHRAFLGSRERIETETRTDLTLRKTRSSRPSTVIDAGGWSPFELSRSSRRTRLPTNSVRRFPSELLSTRWRGLDFCREGTLEGRMYGKCRWGPRTSRGSGKARSRGGGLPFSRNIPYRLSGRRTR
ncbi:hypothetical protein AAT19DRAFT_12800 [Rhodotorula toruloides]|uniref:Uncharacterized protein n=1 Tax=Rhodotorula toruloides TaxID=5286 RepID=A0A2T0ACP1_RHOTO|nr:hypothetical protein AAT19DRAFT_12800 [Rhodotorula toruloides]